MRLKHRDRVTHPRFPDKVFTVIDSKECNFFTLYGINENTQFTMWGKCTQAPIRSKFKVGDKLNFYKTDSEY